MPARFTRRSVLALVGFAAMSPEAKAALACPSEEVHPLRCPVAGLAYYDYAWVAGALPVGTPLVLRRQPANPHDRRAIEVLTEDGVKLGYVPRADNAALPSLMDAGYALQAEVVGVGQKVWPLTDGGEHGRAQGAQA